MRNLALSVMLLFSSIPAFAQELACHGGEVGWIPRDILVRPLPLRQNIGSVDERVTTSVPEAQAYYSQGAAYLHSYVWIEAGRSFNQALRRDPRLAMAHLGLARTFMNLSDRPAARRELERARALSEGISPREKRRIELFASQLDAVDDLDDVAKHLAYKKALDDALVADFGDPELWILRGNAEEGTAAGRGQRGGAASIAFYERALRVKPGHFAAHHFLIHSCEMIGKIDDALVHGETYSKAAPAIPHAHHMYGHDLRRVGRIGEAIAAFERADKLEREYFEAENISRELDWHHPHNLDLLAGSYRHIGKMAMAEKLWRESSSIRPVTEYQAFAKADLPAFLLSRGRVSEAMSEAKKLTAASFPAARAIGHVLLGETHLAKGDLAAAEASLREAERERDTVKGDFGKQLQSALRPYIETLRGSMYVRTGKQEEGRKLLRQMQQAFRAIPGPDAWAQALFKLELIAAQARQAGDWDLAEYTARQMLEHDAAYAGSHYAIALVAEQKGDRALAAKELAEARRYWSGADANLPELASMRGTTARGTE